VRTSYVECMMVCFNGNTLGQAGALVPLLAKKVEKAASQPTQPAVVTEGLAASCLLLKLALADASLDAKLASFWQVVLDMEHHVFLSEKFLSQCPPATLRLVAQLCGLLLDAKKTEDELLQPVHRALILCITSHDRAVRDFSKTLVKRSVQALGGSKLACYLLKEMDRFLDSYAPDKETDEDAKGEVRESNLYRL